MGLQSFRHVHISSEQARLVGFWNSRFGRVSIVFKRFEVWYLNLSYPQPYPNLTLPIPNPILSLP